MSLAQPQSIQERRPSPGGMTLNLNSNNPFRRASPGMPSPGITTPRALTSPIETEDRPMSSTNPFLDSYQAPPRPVRSPDSAAQLKPVAYDPKNRQDTAKPTQNATDLLNGLVISDQSSDRPVEKPLEATNGRPPVARLPPGMTRVLKPRGPPPRSGTIPMHRPRLSNEDEAKIRKAFPRSGKPTGSPERKENRRPRRNSDTSVFEVKEEERKSKAKEGLKDEKQRRSRKANRQVDIIDKLDVTGIYGVGMFHHDGPFDACNPHRNRKGSRAAPMRAFAEGSLNNSLGGSGPVNKDLDFDRIHGRGAEGFSDYNTTQAMIERSRVPRRPAPQPRPEQALQPAPQTYPSPAPSIYFDDPKGKTELHGHETMGLGTSTFLEGAPAPRSMLQRHESETDTQPAANSGLTRKKSLAQKIRGISKPKTGIDFVGPDNGKPGSPGSPKYVQSAGGRAKMNEKNPFFSEVETQGGKSVDADMATFTTVTRARTASSPRRGMMQRPFNDNTPSSPESKGGLLSRVKSLKGPRKARPEKQDTKPAE